MQHMHMVTDGENFMDVVRSGWKNKYNRQASDAVAAMGIMQARCTLILLHEHRGGEQVPPHWRSMWTVQLEDGNSFGIMLDCDPKTWATIEWDANLSAPPGHALHCS